MYLRNTNDEDQAIFLTWSSSPPYDQFMDTIIFGGDAPSMEEVKTALNSKELKRRVVVESTTEGSNKGLVPREGSI